MERLLRLVCRNNAPMPACFIGAAWRITSPSGDSTLMISAP